jgi:formylglycine-generating enzyme required for sulfatase activity
MAQFHRFRKDHPRDPKYSPTEDCPAGQVTWFDAAAYCNWLSEQEGFPRDQWCYLPNAKGQYAEGMKVAGDFLRRTGYRLPTDAEREHACRAGSVTGWSFGEDENLLVKYAWFQHNSMDKMHPVGLLRPNDLGLFDLHGNLWEWCQDKYQSRGNAPGVEGAEDDQDKKSISGEVPRGKRGGSFMGEAVGLRSSTLGPDFPKLASYYDGFRPARTVR